MYDNSNAIIIKLFEIINEEKKEKVKLLKEKTKIKRKKYYNDNKDKIRLIQKKYYEKNRKHIIEYQNQKFNCPCNGKYTRTNKAQHERTTKHKQYIQSTI